MSAGVWNIRPHSKNFVLPLRPVRTRRGRHNSGDVSAHNSTLETRHGARDKRVCILQELPAAALIRALMRRAHTAEPPPEDEAAGSYTRESARRETRKRERAER